MKTRQLQQLFLLWILPIGEEEAEQSEPTYAQVIGKKVKGTERKSISLPLTPSALHLNVMHLY